MCLFKIMVTEIYTSIEKITETITKVEENSVDLVLRRKLIEDFGKLVFTGFPLQTLQPPKFMRSEIKTGGPV